MKRDTYPLAVPTDLLAEIRRIVRNMAAAFSLNNSADPNSIGAIRHGSDPENPRAAFEKDQMKYSADAFNVPVRGGQDWINDRDY